MKILIAKIKIVERIRKEIAKIDGLASDIQQNGLINAVTVMPTGGGEYQLLAGFRRMKAVQSLGWAEIEGHVVSPADAEAALHIEIAENEQREPFTFAEKIYYGLLLEEVEAVKAKKRMSAGGNGGFSEGVDQGPHLRTGKRRDAIGEMIGMCGRQYDRAKYVAARATPEEVDQINKGERTIRGMYDALRAREKAGRALVPADPAPVESQARQKRQTTSNKKKAADSDHKLASDSSAAKNDPYLAQLKAEEAEHNRAVRKFNALSPEGKIEELQRQLREARARAAGAESELTRLKELRHNDIYHNEAIIEGLKRQNSELTAALAATEARIRELEGVHECA